MPKLPISPPEHTLLTVILTVLSLTVSALQTLKAQRTLSYSEFLSIVRNNHPIAKQAALLQQAAEAEVLKARGLFDTRSYSNWDKKSFDGKTYYLEGESGFKTPSWYGLSWKTEYILNSGIYVNPENQVPSIGQLVAGIEMSALQGLLIDERRTALKLARQLVLVNANERYRILNQLLLDASEAYWNWLGAYQQVEVIRTARDLAAQRFEGVKESYSAGDKPAIDTLEAWVLVRTRDAELVEHTQYLFETAQKMSVFVWSEGLKPLEADDSLRPDVSELNSIDLLLQELQPDLSKHPEIIRYTLKQTNLEIDQRWKREKLKPKLQVEYNFLGNGTNLGPPPGTEGISGLLLQNYKWAIRFSQPLFLRSERADLKLNKLKLQENNFDRELKIRDLTAQRKAATNRLIAARSEVVILESVVRDYAMLLAAEVTKFEIGESSIFLINSRDNKRIEAELKLAKARTALKKAEAAYRWLIAQWP